MIVFEPKLLIIVQAGRVPSINSHLIVSRNEMSTKVVVLLFIRFEALMEDDDSPKPKCVAQQYVKM